MEQSMIFMFLIGWSRAALEIGFRNFRVMEIASNFSRFDLFPRIPPRMKWLARTI